MRSDARKRTVHLWTHANKGGLCGTNHPSTQVPGEVTCADCLRMSSPAVDPLAPIVALAEAADRQFGSAQNISRDALWAAIRVARGDQA